MGLENIREIKFRYIFVYKDSGVMGCFIRTLAHIEQATDFPLRPCQIIAKNQYTNKKDINNEEIYEDDVVAVTPLNYTEEIIGQVVWKHGGFVIEPFLKETIDYNLKYGKFRKLGDIYHNKGDFVKEK